MVFTALMLRMRGRKIVRGLLRRAMIPKVTNMWILLVADSKFNVEMDFVLLIVKDFGFLKWLSASRKFLDTL